MVEVAILSFHSRIFAAGLRCRPGLVAGSLLCCALALLAIAAPVRAQRFATVTFGIDEGLPSPTVLELEQDASDRLWVRTRAGLATFDGTSFSLQRPFFDRPADAVAAIALGPDGSIWAVSEYLHTAPMVFRDGRWSQPLPAPPTYKDELVYDLKVGRSKNGEIWVAIALDSGRLLVGTEQGWRSPARQTSTGRESIIALEKIGHRLYIAYAGGLSYWEGEEMIAVPVDLVATLGGAPMALHGDPSARLWVLSRRWLGYLDGDRLVAADLKIDLHLRSLTNVRPASLAADGEGTVYFGTASTLHGAHESGGPIREIGRQQGLIADGVSSLLVDRSSNLWVGGVRGLSVVVAGGVLSWGQAQGLLEDEVSALVEWPSPGRFVLGHNRGLSIWDGGRIEHRAFGEPLLSGTRITEDRVMAFAVGPGGSLFLAAGDRGVGRLDHGAGLRWYGPDRGLRTRVSDVETSADGRVWATTAEGLHLLDRELDRFTLATEKGQLPHGSYLRGVLRDPEGLLFLTTSRGLLRGRPGDWTLIAPGEASPELAQDVYAVVLDSRGDLWAGTSAGLYRIREQVWELFEGVDHAIYSLAEVPWGGLLAGTADGLLALREGKGRRISVEEGLIGRETNRGALGITDDEKAWIGTAQGLSLVTAEALMGNASLARLELVGLEVDGVVRDHEARLEVGPGIESIVYRFEAISLPTTGGLQYQARLEGFDRDWSAPAPVVQNVLRYTNVPAGEYRLELQLIHRDRSPGSILRSPILRISSPTRDELWFKVLVGLLAFSFGLLLYYRGVVRRQKRRIDELTGLGNRLALEEVLGDYLEQGQIFALFFLDLDRFKSVHDALGRQVSDQLLRRVGDRLRLGAAPRDFVAHLGGDEFVVLRPDISDPASARSVAEKIQDLLRSPFSIEGRKVFSEATVGVTLGPGDYRWPPEVIRDADIAMYRIKSERRGGVRVFDPEMHTSTLAQYQLEMELREVIYRGELELRYQPIVRQSDGRVEALEALLRWRHPERGLLTPGYFLELAEETGSIVEMGAWVIERACRDWQIWREAMPAGHLPWISVNISPRQIEDRSLVKVVRDTLAQTAVPYSAIGFEITERSVMRDPELAGALLRELRAMGLRLLMDDFGTGQSSLSHLSRLPIQVLKIDRSFLGSAPKEDGISKILDSIAALGTRLGLQVVCEGVETEDQLRRLRKLEDCLLQGFLISLPVESGEVPALLREAPWQQVL